MRILIAMALPLLLAMPAGAAETIGDATNDSLKQIGSGMASYYGNELAGKRTASGEKFDPHGLTAAHRTLAFGSKVRVTNLANGKDVIVRINDRGPWGGRRMIDISLGAAKKIGMHKSGTAKVSMHLLSNED